MDCESGQRIICIKREEEKLFSTFGWGTGDNRPLIILYGGERETTQKEEEKSVFSSSSSSSPHPSVSLGHPHGGAASAPAPGPCKIYISPRLFILTLDRTSGGLPY